MMPWPPTVNHYYTIRSSRKMLSREGRAYKHTAAMPCDEPFTTSVSVSIVLSPPDNRKRDIDNCVKPILDALQFAGVFEDDNIVDRLSVVRSEMSFEGGTAWVQIEEL